MVLKGKNPVKSNILMNVKILHVCQWCDVSFKFDKELEKLLDFKLCMEQWEEVEEEKLEKKQKRNFIKLWLCLFLYTIPNHGH